MNPNPQAASDGKPVVRYRRFTPFRIAAFVVIVGGMFAYEGNLRQPTPPASGSTFGGVPPTTQPAGTLRVATFNMAGGVGTDERFDLDRTAGAIKGFDIVGLQEVHGASYPWSGDQAAILGGKLHQPWLFAPSETRWWHDDFGNGAITDLPVIHWQRFPLSGAASETNRCMLLLRLTYQDKPLNVLVTHLDRHEDHDAELDAVLNLFESLDKPAILLADLNSEPSDPKMGKLRQLADATGITLSDKTGSLDWIFARGMHAVNAQFTDTGASDHKLEWAELAADK